MIASDILKTAAAEMDDRAKTYDQPQGERSMAKTVATYNALTGQTLTELDGWKFMACLKLARSEQGDHRPDNYIDGAAYMALAGESASTGNQAGREPFGVVGIMSEKTITELAKSSALFSATTRLTAKKTDELISRGMAITGFVLTNLATNDKSTVDLGRVNWHPVTEAGRNEPINAELLSAAKTAEKWLQSWLDEKLCECEGYHYCGRTEREAELAQIKTAIRNAMGNGRMSDQTPACSICTTTAWTQDELQPLPIRLHRATIIDLCPDCLDALSKHISALRSVAGRAMRTGLPKQVKETK